MLRTSRGMKFDATLALLTGQLLFALLARPAQGLKCFTSYKSYVNLSESVSCMERFISCHEYFYLLKGADTFFYRAGCGPYFRTREEENKIADGMVAANSLECFSDNCNRQLYNDLVKRSRVCYYANRDKKYTNFAALCAFNVTKCYLDSMPGSKEPRYYAGCGSCPSYTLYCYTCETGNYCKANEMTSRKIIYQDELGSESDKEHPTVQSDSIDGNSALALGLAPGLVEAALSALWWSLSVGAKMLGDV